MGRLIIPTLSWDNENDIRANVRHVVAGGDGGEIVFCMGRNGEYNVLHEEQKHLNIDVTIDEARKIKAEHRAKPFPLQVAVGVSEPTVEGTIKLAQYAEAQGADILVLMPVFYSRRPSGKCTRHKNTQNTDRILAATSKPVILYTHSGMQDGKHLRTDQVKAMCQRDRIVALKASVCNGARIRHYQKAAGDNAEVFIGDSALGLRIPSAGVVAGDANVFPVAYKIAVERHYHEESAVGLLAGKLEALQEKYASNSILGFKMILHRLGITQSDTIFDPTLRPVADFSESIDALMEEKAFKDTIALNISA